MAPGLLTPRLLGSTLSGEARVCTPKRHGTTKGFRGGYGLSSSRPMRRLTIILAILAGCAGGNAALDRCIEQADELLETREQNARRTEPNQAEYDEAVDRFFEEYEEDLADCHARYR